MRPQGRARAVYQSPARTVLVITSPPYANNYDYADATRLEMTFLGEVNGWGDLQAAVRSRLVRSCTQHVAPYAGFPACWEGLALAHEVFEEQTPPRPAEPEKPKRARRSRQARSAGQEQA